MGRNIASDCFKGTIERVRNGDKGVDMNRELENDPFVQQRNRPERLPTWKKVAIGTAVIVPLLVAVLVALIMAAANASDILKVNVSLQGLHDSRVITFIRWGHLECPPTPGTTKVYHGFGAGTYHTNNTPTPSSLCLPASYQHVRYNITNSLYGDTKVFMVHGIEYNTFILDRHGKGVGCALCKTTSRSTVLMIPATDRCNNTTPTDNSWTKEYDGYLMQASGAGSDYYCVDYNMRLFYDPQQISEVSTFSHVAAGNDGPQVSSYNPQRVLSCVVCTI